VSVLRSLEDAQAEWLEERATCPETSALLHAGANRPSFEAFRSSLESHKGHLLMSESARWLLPEGHAECRIAQVSLNSIPKQRSQPLYVATAGWGYEISLAPTDDVIVAARAERVPPEEYERVLKTIDPDDPFEVARICPSGLRGVPLCELPLTVRCQNVLDNMKISTIADLQNFYLKDTSRWTNFGKKSAVDLARALQRFIGSRVRSGNIPVSVADSCEAVVPVEEGSGLTTASIGGQTLLQDLDEFRSTLNQPQQKVLEERVLKQNSLELVGKLLGVTRERTRQIESRLFDRMAKLPWTLSLRDRLSKLLMGRTDPLFLDLAEVEDSWFSGWSMRSRELAALIKTFPSDLTVLRIENRLIVSRITSERFRRVLKRTLDSLSQQIHEGWTRSDVDLFVEGAVRSEKAPELAQVALDLLLPEIHFSRTGVGGQELLCGVGGRMKELITAVLRSTDTPLHYSEIAAAASERAGRPFSVRYIHSILQRMPALFFGRGRYGLDTHYPLSEDLEVELAGVLEDIMSVDRQRQWHTAELFDSVEGKGEDLPEVFDKYILNILLSRSPQFQGMGRMVWSLKAGGGGDTRGRIDLTDACVQVLVQSGKPLSSSEVKERIGRLRGTSEFFMIQPNERIARVAPSKWGLVERDCGLSVGERTQFFTNLEAELYRRGSGLHVSELLDVVGTACTSSGNLTNYTLLGLAQTDARFRVHRGHIIALAVWNDARRPTVRYAVSLCVNGQAEVMVHDLLDGVAAVVGREVLRGEVTSLLLQMGWQWRKSTDTYVSYIGDEDESVEEAVGEEIVSGG